MFYDTNTASFFPDPQACAACGIECDLEKEGMCGPCADTTIEPVEGPLDPIQAALTSPIAGELYASNPINPIMAIQRATITSSDTDGLTLADCLRRLNLAMSADLAGIYAAQLRRAALQSQIASWMLVDEICIFTAPAAVVELAIVETIGPASCFPCAACDHMTAPVGMGLCDPCADDLTQAIEDAGAGWDSDSVCAACGDEWATVSGSLCAPCLSEFAQGFDPIEPVDRDACEWPADSAIAHERFPESGPF